MKKAIILLSGGIDSLVCAAIAKTWGFEIYALSFDYGQKNIQELKAAEVLAPELGAVEHKILTIPAMSVLSKGQPYIPARNTIFLALALGYAEVIGATDLFIGINKDDNNFPDCTLSFFYAFNALASVATKKPVLLNAPLLTLTKAEIIKKGAQMGLNFENTITCYGGNCCGECPACLIRIDGFKMAGIIDTANPN